MKLARFVTVVLIAILIHSASAADGFAKWWSEFQAAVARRDAKAVAQRAHFPLSWENGPVREIKTEAEFLQRFRFRARCLVRRAGIGPGGPSPR